MPSPILRAEHLAKAFGKGRKLAWALDDVSFEVAPGEIVGLVGRNGAGKTTLLKLLSRITLPTRGRARLLGRVSSLLEIGTGFHQELTGRENIFLNGAILGMRRREIALKLDAIVAFAEIERHLDTPVKHYSSGMYVRLAFAIAAHLEPEILLVDEVLAVGDYAFQQKCLDRTETFAGEGRTVLFVSHNLGAVSRLCPRSLLLDRGRLVADGRTPEVIREYVSRGVVQRAEVTRAPDPSRAMSLTGARILASDGACRAEIGYHERIALVIDYEIHAPVTGASVAIAVGTADQIPVFASADYDSTPERLGAREPGAYRAVVEIPEQWLNTGKYVVGVYLAHATTGQAYDKFEGLSFDVVETETACAHRGIAARRGVLQPLLLWHTETLKAAA